MKPSDYIELNRRILAAIDGTITSEEFAFLDEGIRTNPQIADHYAEFMLLYTGLRQPGQGSACFSKLSGQENSNFDMRLWSELDAYEKSAETIEIPSCQPNTAKSLLPVPVLRIERKISRLAVYTSILSAAALILMMLYVKLNPLEPQSVVGVLAETVDAKWHHSSIAPETGQDINTGSMELQWGLARICFDSGADVIVEGPAQVKFLSPNSMQLVEGKLYAKVGREATGFTVLTPGGTVRDIGTEFGVQVRPTGQAEVSVYKGEVHLFPDNAEHFVQLFSGQSKSMTAGGPIQDIPFQPMSFVRHEEMDARAQASASDYQRWKAAVLNLHRDPSLMAHYFYSQDAANPELLINAAPSAGTNTNGRFGTEGRNAPQWVAGRWPQKRAVRFERGKAQSIRIAPDRSLSINGPMTVSAWVQFPNAKQMGGHLISCREEEHINYQWSLFDSQYVYNDQCNRFEFLRYSPKDNGAYSQPCVLAPGQWYHLAMTYDTQTLSFFVNGTLFEKKNYTVAIRSRDTEIILGAMKLKGKYVYPQGDFDGIVDELMIFNRCMSEREIQSIYDSGVPAADTVFQPEKK